MKLKALLLGSAAAMIAVSGARAADAVIAEPEPVEYVRVCDMYGPGFFYIPGTETCLKFSGYVRTDYTYNDNDGAPSTSGWVYRVRLNVDARNETDWGTLRSQIRFQSDADAGYNGLNVLDANGAATGDRAALGSDGIVGIDRALISLGGLRTGYSDSFTTTHHNYGTGVEKYDGYYGYDQAIFLDYTYAANGFSATAGLQDSTGASPAAGNHVDLEYYAGVAYSNSLFTLAASYIYEDAADDGAWKVSGVVKPVDGLTIQGFYVGDSDGTTRSVEGTGNYAWGVGAAYQVTDTVNVRAAWTDAETLEAYATVGLNWTPVPGLAIRPEVQIREDTGQSYSVRVYRTF